MASLPHWFSVFEVCAYVLYRIKHLGLLGLSSFLQPDSDLNKCRQGALTGFCRLVFEVPPVMKMKGGQCLQLRWPQQIHGWVFEEYKTVYCMRPGEKTHLPSVLQDLVYKWLSGEVLCFKFPHTQKSKVTTMQWASSLWAQGSVVMHILWS